jgi:hypothetical protein
MPLGRVRRGTIPAGGIIFVPRARRYRCRNGCRYGCRYAPSYCIDTQYRQAQAKFCGYFNWIRSRLRQIPAATDIRCWLFCFASPFTDVTGRPGGADLAVACWCLGTSRPAGRHCPSFESVPKPGGVPTKHHRRERPQARGARPAEYRRPASRPGRSRSPHHPHNEHSRAGYRTAQPSDSPPRASRYALTAAQGRTYPSAEHRLALWGLSVKT